jgi:hypothetical protein
MIVLAWDGKSVADDGFSEVEREAAVERAKEIAQQLVEIITSQQQPEMEETHGIGYSNYSTHCRDFRSLSSLFTTPTFCFL